MSRQREEVVQTLREHGAVMVRQTKHQVWKLPDGKTFVVASTPSDVRADKNSLAILRNTLGINDPTRGQDGERRERSRKRAAHKTHVP